jgi:hypothetical protein
MSPHPESAIWCARRAVALSRRTGLSGGDEVRAEGPGLLLSVGDAGDARLRHLWASRATPTKLRINTEPRFPDCWLIQPATPNRVLGRWSEVGCYMEQSVLVLGDSTFDFFTAGNGHGKAH